MLNTQTHLRDPLIEIYKVGEWEQAGGEKRETVRWAMDAALPPGVHSGAEPGDERDQVVAGTAFREEQRDSVGILAGVGITHCGWARWPGQGQNAEVQLPLSGSWHSRQRSKATEPDHSLTSLSLPPFALGVGLQSTLFTNLRTGTAESLFPWAKGTLCGWSQDLGHRMPSITWRSKQLRRQLG